MNRIESSISAALGWRKWAFSAGAGLLLGLGQTPFGMWPLAFVAGYMLFTLWRSGQTRRGDFAIGWAAGATYFALTLHWIVEPFLVDAPRYGWMAPFALVLMAGGLALFWGGAFALAGRFREGSACALALAWGMAEALRGWIFTGFPWALPGYIWVDTPVAQIASLIGAYGLTVLTLLAILSMGAKPSRIPAVAVMIGVLGAWVWGDFRQASDSADAPANSAPLIVRLVQPNIPQAQKWDPAFASENFQVSLSLTSAPAQTAVQPNVIIWPEVAVPFTIETAHEARAEIARSSNGAPVILGSLATSPTSKRWRNAMVSLSGSGALASRYDKSHLVPFGEYMPYADLLERVGILALAKRGAGTEAGPPPTAQSVPGLPPFAPLICYEGVFPNEVRTAAQNADWIVLITNDAWFGGWAGPRQHLAQAQMRAIEAGKPVARAANTGITAMISPYGTLLAEIPLGQRGYADTALPAPAPKTIFMRFGNIPTAIVSLILIFVGLRSYLRARLRV